MLKSLASFGIVSAVGIGFIGNPDSTGKCLISIITIRGITFLLRKMTWKMSNDMADILDFTSWCLCAAPAVTIIKNAQLGLAPIGDFFLSVDTFFTNLSNGFEQFANFIDKIMFWS